MDAVCLVEDHGDRKKSNDCVLSEAYGHCLLGRGPWGRKEDE